MFSTAFPLARTLMLWSGVDHFCFNLVAFTTRQLARQQFSYQEEGMVMAMGNYYFLVEEWRKCTNMARNVSKNVRLLIAHEAAKENQ